jgi:hypothetical protein
MLCHVRWAATVALLAAAPVWAADAKYSVKTAKTAVPKEIKGPVAKVLSDRSVQVQDAKGKLVCELWLRKEVPAKAAAAQAKNGLTYQELEETTLLGAVRFVQPGSDYRKQKIKPGVYTLRLGLQPMDGDHMGTAPYPEFCLVVPADQDEKPDPYKDPKELQDLSTQATGTSHPGIFLLFPTPKAEDTPKLEDKGDGHWVLTWKGDVKANGKKTYLGVGLTLFGHSAAQ